MWPKLDESPLKQADKENTLPSSDTGDLKERVTRVLTDEVGPALQLDAGSIEVLDVRDGIAQVRLTGVCAGCPSTIMAVIMGIEQELRKRIPEVEYLEAVP
jgi:Fe-S cluster biogenesis protein NfuA